MDKKRLEGFDPTKIVYNGKRINQLNEEELFCIAYACMAAQSMLFRSKGGES